MNKHMYAVIVAIRIQYSKNNDTFYLCTENSEQDPKTLVTIHRKHHCIIDKATAEAFSEKYRIAIDEIENMPG